MVEGMRKPPGVPRQSTGRPSRSAMSGAMLLRGRLPGAGALGLSSSQLKSSTWLLSRMPSATTPAPKK
jgi:hypothetical protein